MDLSVENALIRFCCFLSRSKCRPTPMPKPSHPRGHPATPGLQRVILTGLGAAPITRPGPREQGLKARAPSCAPHPPAAPQLSGPNLGEERTLLFGALCCPSSFQFSNLAPSSPRRRTRPAGKLLPSCGGASLPPSNAPSNRVTSAPSGPMRAESSCAPASRSEPGARGTSETGGTDLQEPGLPAELQLPLLPLSLSRCHRRRRCQRPSEE